MCIVAAAAIAGVAGAAISASGAQSAAQTQANAATNAQNISQNEFNTITGQEQPFMQAGYGALGNLDYLLGVGPQSGTSPNGYSSNGYTVGPGGSIGRLIPGGTTGGAAAPSMPGAGGYGSLLQPFTTANWQQLSPSYNFQLGQGMQGVLNGEANMAGALSGSAQKDLMGYNQNLANTSFNNAFNMYQTQQGNIYSRLAGLAQMGQAAATNTGQQGTALAGQAAQSAQNVGSALAAGQVGSANAYSNAISGMSYLPWMMSGNSGMSAADSNAWASGANANDALGIAGFGG